MPTEQPSPTETPAPVPIPPDILAWAQQTFDEQEYREGVRDIEATGGRSMDDLITEVEARVRGS